MGKREREKKNEKSEGKRKYAKVGCEIKRREEAMICLFFAYMEVYLYRSPPITLSFMVSERSYCICFCTSVCGRLALCCSFFYIFDFWHSFMPSPRLVYLNSKPPKWGTRSPFNHSPSTPTTHSPLPSSLVPHWENHPITRLSLLSLHTKSPGPYVCSPFFLFLSLRKINCS